LEVVGANGWRVLKDIKVTVWEGLDWIRLSYDMDKQWALLKTTINLRVP
jgi:hypothetical protein